MQLLVPLLGFLAIQQAAFESSAFLYVSPINSAVLQARLGENCFFGLSNIPYLSGMNTYFFESP